jgi:hypothetical protein|tara:strand:- start:51 stop:212 length:162 start_codon:yes stop_codon:yes gene_type:complete
MVLNNNDMCKKENSVSDLQFYNEKRRNRYIEEEMTLPSAINKWEVTALKKLPA